LTLATIALIPLVNLKTVAKVIECVMFDDTVLRVEVASIRHWWDKTKPVDENLLAMFRRVRTDGTPIGWAAKDDELFGVVCGVALLEADAADKVWVSEQLHTLAIIAHAIRGASLGVSVNLSDAAEEMEKSDRREYALMGLWHSSKNAVGA